MLAHPHQLSENHSALPWVHWTLVSAVTITHPARLLMALPWSETILCIAMFRH